jgi:hypothetical protein
MGTKLNPGPYDCYRAALPDEPLFVLLARSPEFHSTVRHWASLRETRLISGEVPHSDYRIIVEARGCAATGAEWRRHNMGRWKTEAPQASPREQKLVDILFAVALRVAEHPGQTKEEICAYAAEQLRQCGFPTVPVGMSWGVLVS